MLIHQELVLSPFEQALIAETPENYRKPRFAQFLAVLTVLLFSLLYVPLAQTAEVPLEGDSVLSVLNQDRLKYGLPMLRGNAQLETAALAKARDMLEQGYFAHTSPSGTKPWEFIAAADFEYAFAGENLAINYTSAYDLQNDFMASPAHRENLLSPLFSEIGIAVLTGDYKGEKATITVQMFASPTETAR